MKKTLITFTLLLVMVVSIFSLSSCNKQISDTTDSFEYAYISLPNGTVIEGKVDSWVNYGEFVKVVVNDKAYLTHYSNVVITSN